jgi:GT2 family glycosyltransferase
LRDERLVEYSRTVPSLVREFPPLGAQEPLTVAIPNFNGRQEIGDAIASVLQSTYRPAEILVIDDGSTDGSAEFIRQRFPDVRVIELGRNSGGMLNQVRNRALREAKTRLVFLMDHDIILEPSCLSVLVSEMRRLPDAGALTTRALRHDDPSRLWVDVQKLHFLCNTVAPNRGGRVSSSDDQPKPSVGWGTQLVDKAKAAMINFFDEDYFIGWGDDGQFHYRLQLAGLRCYSVPRAVVFHKRKQEAGRVRAIVRNRWYMLVECYGVRSLILLAPLLILYEVLLVVYLCLRGEGREYVNCLRDFIRSFPRLLQKRALTQRTRVVPDRVLLSGGPIYVSDSIVTSASSKLALAFMNGVFDAYWQTVRRFI